MAAPLSRQWSSASFQRSWPPRSHLAFSGYRVGLAFSASLSIPCSTIETRSIEKSLRPEPFEFRSCRAVRHLVGHGLGEEGRQRNATMGDDEIIALHTGRRPNGGEAVPRD